MKLIKDLKLSYRMKTLEEGIKSLYTANDEYELERILKQNETHSQFLYKSIQHNMLYIKEIEKNNYYQHNLYNLLHTNKFIDIFFKGKYEEAFNFSLPLFLSSKTIKEKYFFLYASVLSLTKVKETYLDNDLWLEYTSRFYQIEALLNNFFSEIQTLHPKNKNENIEYQDKINIFFLYLLFLDNDKEKIDKRIQELIKEELQSTTFIDDVDISIKRKTFAEYIDSLPFWIKRHYDTEKINNFISTMS